VKTIFAIVAPEFLANPTKVLRGGIDGSEEVYDTVRGILRDIRSRGVAAIREYAETFDGLQPQQKLFYDRSDMQCLAAEVKAADWRLLDEVATRIRAVATAQMSQLTPVRVEQGGCSTGVRYQAVAVAGCYAPGGRYPLPSSMLMTAVTAKAAGVEMIVAASPRPAPIMFAAALVAGVDYLLPFGGAPAISALASGVPGDGAGIQGMQEILGMQGTPAADVIVGPGNQYVTAAKNIAGYKTRIDMPAGPSEIALAGDSETDVRIAAADLIAQAEHDPLARIFIVTLPGFDFDGLTSEINRRMKSLPEPNREIAKESLSRVLAVLCENVAEAQDVLNVLAPEHLAVQVRNPRLFMERVKNYGVVLLGAATPVALADFGAGPNHTLPTGGASRSWGGLSVLNFLRAQYELEVRDTQAARGVTVQSERLARIEGLIGHEESLMARTAPVTGVIRLDANESPFPPFPELKASLNQVFDDLNRYPDGQSMRLRAAIGGFVGVEESRIVCGNGSDEILRLVMQAFVPSNGTILTLWPTFGQYERLAGISGCQVIHVPWEIAAVPGQLAQCVENMRPDLTILTRPNSPCGRVLPKEVVLGLRGRVLIDEAYIDFSGDSILPDIDLALAGGNEKMGDFMVLRTLSKAWGMAGARMGWLVSSDENIAELERYRDPYNCNQFSQVLATAAFALMNERPGGFGKRMRDQIDVVKKERLRIANRLRDLGIQVEDSEANFLWIQDMRAGQWKEELQRRGVLVRHLSYRRRHPFEAESSIEGLRVTIGAPQENDAFLFAFGEML